jgi:hypothetical protein
LILGLPAASSSFYPAIIAKIERSVEITFAVLSGSQ